MAGFATLCWVDMDCANPVELAEFYGQVLGWNVTHDHDESAVITDGSTTIRLTRLITSKDFESDLRMECFPHVFSAGDACRGRH